MAETRTKPAGKEAAAAAHPFAHLHLHTEYSLLDGGNRIDRLMDRVQALGMGAVACTDHGNLFGAVAFYQAARDRGIKPILGVEAYVAPGDRADRTYTGVADGGYHLVLLAENDAGWRNLLLLCSEAFLTGFYYKPRIDRPLLERHGEGLIAINGHLGSEIGEHLLEFERTGDRSYWQKAKESAQWHARVFAPGASGPRCFIELQHHVPEQNSINRHLIALARSLGLPLVCDNDAHFLRAEDHDAHDTLVCISTGKAKNDPDRMRYPPDLYVKSPQEMEALFAPYGADGREALDNAAAIAARCTVTLPLGVSHAPMVRVRRKGPRPDDWEGLPRHDDPAFAGDPAAWYQAYCAQFEVVPFRIEPGAGPDEKKRLLAEAKAQCDAALRSLALAGMTWRYGPDDGADPRARAAFRDRLDRELTILCNKGIAAYFLIVWDFVNWGRQNNVPALARGSGVGTMVGYVLGLSNACPVRYGLLFERFTDPDRSEYPDIDIDLCQDGRARVINYVREKYGHVAQIITFGTLKARAAIRDAGRVLEIPLGEVDKIAKLVPEQLGITLDRALEQEPDFKRLYQTDPAARRCIDNARAFEGQVRHASVHAAGVIVATTPLHEIVPLYMAPGGEDIVTQWDGPTCEKMGLLKMDFLGLRTISVVERAKKLIRDGLPEEEIWNAVGRGDDYSNWQRDKATARPPAHPLDLDRLTFDDQKVFELFRRGDTTGVFQFESPGMRRMLVEMKPDRLEDLIAANALFRPGPMDLIPDYTRRKHGQAPVPKVHEIVDGFTAETYGVMVYQEQVMQIVHGLGGIGLRDAYTLIKNISKKRHDKIDKERPRFIEGAVRKGLTRQKAEELFELILKFAGYGFNKSHSTGYAIVAYQTAYLKTFFPNQYLAAFLTYESAAMQTADWVPYLEDCKSARFIDPATGRVLRTGVEVRPPDVNKSDADFSVVFEPGEPRTARSGHVRFGLGAIKGAGDKAIGSIIHERERGRAGKPRPYTSIFDFCERVPLGGGGGLGNGGSVNKATLEALIKSGAMDCLYPPDGRRRRAEMMATLESAMGAGVNAQADLASGQGALFGLEDPAPAAAAKPAGSSLVRAEAWSDAETLANEKEALGFYVSSHPLDQYAALVAGLGNATTRRIRDRLIGADMRITIGGLITAIRTLVVKSGKSAGQKMGVLALEDKEGQVECVAFSDVFARYSEVIRTDAVVFITGKVDHTRGEPQVIVESVVPMESAASALARKVRLTVDERRHNGRSPTVLEDLLGVIRPAPAAAGGKAPTLGVEIVVLTEDHEVWLETTSLRIAPTEEMVGGLRTLLGSENVVMVGAGVEAARREPRPWERRSGGGDGGK